MFLGVLGWKIQEINNKIKSSKKKKKNQTVEDSSCPKFMWKFQVETTFRIFKTNQALIELDPGKS